MVAVVIGSRLGLEQTSGWVLGSRGMVGQSAMGRSGENVFLNGATGNLVVTNRDEFLVGLGADSSLSRTYNSLGATDGDNGDGWRMSATRRITESGGVPTRTDWDGSSVLYVARAGGGYRTTEGSGAYDILEKVGDEWVWTDGDTQIRETYARIGSTNEYRLASRTDASGNTVSFTYNANGYIWKVSTQVGARTELTEFIYDTTVGKTANVKELKTSFWNGSAYQTLTRTRYAYDASNRLTSVTVDLSPTDNAVTDGRTYVTTYTYDGTSKRIASISQTDGSRIDVTYESSGAFRVTSITQTVTGNTARTTNYSYGTNSITVAQGGVSTVMTYDSAGQLLTVTEPPATSGGVSMVRTFSYNANGDVELIKTSDNVWTRFIYPSTGDNQGLWTEQHDNLGNGATLAVSRTYTARNAVATETRYLSADANGITTGSPGDPITSRYIYDSANRLVFSISAAGVVTRNTYGANGLLERTTTYTLYGAAPTATDWVSQTAMDAWVTALTGAQKAASSVTAFTYDFRGEITDTYAYSQTLSSGEPDITAAVTHTRYVYDQAGQLLLRQIDDQAGSEAFVYDGMGRVIHAIDFNGASTRTAYLDSASTTVITNADGLNQISVYNRAGEMVSVRESRQAPNLINLNGWPTDTTSGSVPTGPAGVNGWQNLNGMYTETQWSVVSGPNGRQIVAMQAGQSSDANPQGGGQQTNSVTIDGAKAYEFVYYFKKPDQDRHGLYFGLSPHATQAYVETNGTWADNLNPYFYGASTAVQKATFDPTRWYKVVAYVLPQGTATVPAGAVGGVYDMTTGAKVASTQVFRWNDARPDNNVFSRFFLFNDNGAADQVNSTYFGQPEVREIDLRGPNLVDNTGWPDGWTALDPNAQAVLPSWNRPGYTLENGSIYADETHWTIVAGPNGRQIVAIEARQMDSTNEGGGALTNRVTIDGNSAYEFVYYFRKTDVTAQNILFGIGPSDTAQVENAVDGSYVGYNPTFYNGSPVSQNGVFDPNRWYKVVGYILPQGSPNIAANSMGGVFDAETGAKVANTLTFRWKADRSSSDVHSRFLIYDGVGAGSNPTYFGQPEIHKIDLGRITGISPGAETQYRYDNRGRLVLTVDPAGVRTHFLYDDANRKIAEIDGDGSLTEFRYDANGRLGATIRRANAVSQTTLDAMVDSAGNPIATSLTGLGVVADDANDSWNWTVYDLAGRIIQTIDGVGTTTHYVYDGASRLTGTRIHVHQFGATELAGFRLGVPRPPQNPQFPETHTTDRATRIFYDADGRQIGALDAEGYLTITVRDQAGRAIGARSYSHKTTQPDAAFDAIKTELDALSPSNDILTWTLYDARGFVRATVDGEGGVLLYDYSPLGHVTRMTRGLRTDAPTADASPPALATLQAATADQFNGQSVLEETVYVRNQLGQVLSETRRALRGASPQTATVLETITYTYDSLRRLIGTHVDRAAGTDYGVQRRYDSRGRLTGELNAAGTAALVVLGSRPSAAAVELLYQQYGTTYAYDDADRLLSVTGPTGMARPGGAGTTAVQVTAPARTVYFYNAGGQLAYEMNALGEVVGYTYDMLNRLVSTIRFADRVPSPHTLTGGPVPTGIAASWSLTTPPSSASITTIAYNTDNTVKSTTVKIDATASTVTSFEYNAFKQVSRRIDQRGALMSSASTRIATFTYDRRGLTVGMVEDAGAGSTYLNRSSSTQYDAFGRVTATLDGRGLEREIAYDRVGRVILQKDPYDLATHYQYDARGNVVRIQDRLNRVTQISYDAFNREIRSTSPNGVLTTTVADERGLTLSVAKGGRTTTWTYDVDGRVISTTDAAGNTATNTYDSAGHLYEVVDARGTKVRYSYDAAGRVLTETVDPSGLNLTTTYAYDARGQRTRITDGSGRITEITYNLRGDQTDVIVDPGAGGKVLHTRYEFDRAGNVLKVIEAYGQAGLERTTQFEYDNLDRLTRKQTGPATLNIVSEYVYDANGNVVSRKDWVDATTFVTTRFAYDNENRLTFTVDGSGAVTRSVYDVEGQLVQSTAYAQKPAFGSGFVYTHANIAAAVGALANETPHHTYFVYNPDGRLSFTLDALRHLTWNEYAPNGDLLRTTDFFTAVPAGASLVYEDLRKLANGETLLPNSTSLGAAGSRQARFVYDAAGRQTHLIDTAGYVTTYVRDGAGNVVRQVAFATRYTAVGTPSAEDMATWTTARAADSGNRTTRLVYDGAGRLAYSVDPERYVSGVTYDGAGRKLTETRYSVRLAANALTDTSTASALNDLLTADADKATTSYVYDSAGRLEQVFDAAGVQTLYKLDALGQITEIVRANNDARYRASTFNQYDGAGRRIGETREITASTSVRTVWTYDGLGRRLSETRGLNPAYADNAAQNSENRRVTTWTYDAMGRVLTSSVLLDVVMGADVWATTTNTYDAFGNLKTVQDPRGNVGRFFYDDLNRLTWQVDPEGYVTRTTRDLAPPSGFEPGYIRETVTRYYAPVSASWGVSTPPSAPAGVAAVTTVVRDKLDRVVRVTDAQGYSETYGLNAFGDRVSLTNKVGGVTSYTYDGRGLVETETLPVTSLPAGGGAAIPVVNRFTYDARGNLKTSIEAFGLPEARTTTYDYDKLDRVITKTGDPVQVTTRSDTGVYSTTPQPNVETITYDALGNVIRTVVASGARTLFYYDRLGRKVAEIVETGELGVTPRQGVLRTWSYDGANNPIEARVYDAAFTLPDLSETDKTLPSLVSYATGPSRLTTFRYDRNNRQTETSIHGVTSGRYVPADGGTPAHFVLSTDTLTTTTRYDAAGHVIQTTDPRGGSTRFYYDSLGRQTAKVDAEGYLTSWTHDAEGNVKTEIRFATRATGALTDTGYPTPSITSNDRITEFEYDLNGQRTSEIRKNVQSWSVSTTGVMTSDDLVDGLVDAVILYTYDGLGNVRTKREANLDLTTNTYDVLGRLIQVDYPTMTDRYGSPNRRQVTNTYNGLGGITKVTDGAAGDLETNLRVTLNTYGAGGRLIRTSSKVNIAGETATFFNREFAYDKGGNVVRETWLRERADGATVIEGRAYDYDAQGRIVSQASMAFTGGSWSTTNWNVLNGTWTMGDSRDVAYNAHGEIVSKGVNGIMNETFEYDAGGRVIRTNTGDGVVRMFGHDANGNVTLTITSTGADLSSVSFATALGMITSTGQSWIDGGNRSDVTATFMRYDARNQLTDTIEPDRELRAVGRPDRIATLTSGRTYNAFGEVASETDARLNTTYFHYNTMGRLTLQVNPGVFVTDPNGVTSSGLVTPEVRSYFDISGRLVATRDANGNLTRRTLMAGTGHNGQDAVTTAEFRAGGDDLASSQKTWYGVDVFGQTVTITNGLMNVQEHNYDLGGRLRSVYHETRKNGTETTEDDNRLVDYFGYDGLGQRIQHWNNVNGSSKELTGYDADGRVISFTDFEGHTTAYSFVWNDEIATDGMTGLTGGWVQTTTHVSGRTSESHTNYFGREVDKKDLGGNLVHMAFDKGGRLIQQTSRLTATGPIRQNLTFTWYDTGLMAGQTDNTGNLYGYSTSNTTSAYEYDVAGARTRETYTAQQWSYTYSVDNELGWQHNATLTSSPVTLQDAFATYDALGRLVSVIDAGGINHQPITVNYTYDLNGNVRSTSYIYTPFGQSTPAAEQTFYYRYDAQNRFTLVKGIKEGGNIIRGSTGQEITYDAAGNRATATYTRNVTETWGEHLERIEGYPLTDTRDWSPGDPAPTGWQVVKDVATYTSDYVENYTYTEDGYLTKVGLERKRWDSELNQATMRAAVTVATDTRDLMGRVTDHQEFREDGALAHWRKNILYDKASNLLHDETFTQGTNEAGVPQWDSYSSTITDYFYRAETFAGSNVFEGAWEGVITRTSTVNGGAAGQTYAEQRFDYVWYDQARQSVIHNDGQKPNLEPNSYTSDWTSTFSYDANGRLTFVNIKDGRRRNLTYITDANGQILSRSEVDGAAGEDPQARYYYFNGVRIGEIGNDGGAPGTYVDFINERGYPGGGGSFRKGLTTGLNYGAFSQAYSALTPETDTSSGMAWTVRDGETLQTIAQAAWGDASLWYLIADANGLSSASVLVAGQSLVVPAKVANFHNTSQTFRPYDPNDAMGNTSPTQPMPYKGEGGCGFAGQVLAVVIAVVVTYWMQEKGAWIAAKLLSAAGVTAATTTGAAAVAVGGAAIAGATGSLASQAFLVAVGNQSNIDWKSVAISAISAGFSKGIEGSVFGEALKGGFTGIAGEMVRGAAVNVLVQGVAVTTGLQHKFSWTSVAAAAAVSAANFASDGGLTGGKGLDLGQWTNPVRNAFGAFVGAGARTLIDGSSFGDNLLATLPDVIGATVANMYLSRSSRAPTLESNDYRAAQFSDIFGSDGPATRLPPGNARGSAFETDYGIDMSGSYEVASLNMISPPSPIAQGGQPAQPRGFGGWFLDRLKSFGNYVFGGELISDGRDFITDFGNALKPTPGDHGRGSNFGETPFPLPDVTTTRRLQLTEPGAGVLLPQPSRSGPNLADLERSLRNPGPPSRADWSELGQGRNIWTGEPTRPQRLPPNTNSQAPRLSGLQRFWRDVKTSSDLKPEHHLAIGVVDAVIDTVDMFGDIGTAAWDAAGSASMPYDMRLAVLSADIRGELPAWMPSTRRLNRNLDQFGTEVLNTIALYERFENNDPALYQEISDAAIARYGSEDGLNNLYHDAGYGGATIATGWIGGRQAPAGAQILRSAFGLSDEAIVLADALPRFTPDGLPIRYDIPRLYHYTSEAGLKSILESKSLNPSLRAITPNDARYGNGQYLSDIVPGTLSPSKLSSKFVTRPFFGKRFSSFVEIDTLGLPVVEGRTGVYVIRNETPFDITGLILSSGRVTQ